MCVPRMRYRKVIEARRLFGSRSFQTLIQTGAGSKTWRVTSAPFCLACVRPMRETKDKASELHSGHRELDAYYVYNGYVTYQCDTPGCKELKLVDWIV